eukprot:NODE_16_length_41655_cov_0.272813.p4 type:complete len:653 gc:universal NODE_16_length_41655_cov_0.272813:38328-40286(+)
MENLQYLVQKVLNKQDVDDELQLYTKILNSNLKSNTSLCQVDHLIRKKLLLSNSALDYATLFNRLNQNHVPNLPKLLYFLYLVSNLQKLKPQFVIPSVEFMEKAFSTPIPLLEDNEMKAETSSAVFNEQENEFCQDLFFIFQGIDGKFISFKNSSPETSLTFNQNDSLIVKELFRLGELAFQLKTFICTPTNSFLIRSIQSGVEIELRTMQELSISAQFRPLSLLHLYAQVFPFFYRYKFIFDIFKEVDTSELTSAAIDLIISYLDAGFASGDDLKRELSERFLNLISKPYREQIYNWMMYGELNDPFNEFFIVKNEENYDFPNSLFWSHAFYSRSSSIPLLKNEKQRELILNVGKSSRLLGLSDSNSTWLINNFKTFEKQELNLRDKSGTLKLLKKIKTHVDRQLISLFKDKLQLFQCMQFLKDLFFTQRGDLLLETYHQLQQYLEMPANAIVYEASSIVDFCYKQHYKYPYKCKLVILNFSDRSLLWSCLCFQPEFPFPLDNFFDNKIIKRYQGMFGFFNSLKYIYYRLTHLWKQLKSLYLIVKVNVPQFYKFLRIVAVWNQQYVSIISQVLYYSLYEVVEKNCKDLDSFIKTQEYGLQELISEHVNVIKTLRGATSLESDNNTNYSNLWQLLQDLHKYVLQQVIWTNLE